MNPKKHIPKMGLIEQYEAKLFPTELLKTGIKKGLAD